ncbi:hypothetical protein GIB67_043293 [Kingdonia uniflora]|uniref:Heparanase-like protein 2 n=1 Tax=Kingdonia uniflora TaxID=39325 RepID=A0A7J7MJF2_9MAGN|nr:hypothetical protein GIB67_043293 [Kingdonia uniflora]
MGVRILVLSLVVFSELFQTLAEDVIVKVEGMASIATTDDNFVCATLDWWPSGKCNYGQCPWEKAGILNLDLNNTILFNAIKAFSSLRIRIGGSLQDQVLYNVGNAVKKCPHFKNSTDGLFGFSKVSLFHLVSSMLTSKENTRAVTTFGLNALFGRKKISDDGLYGGNWNSKNARDFIQYSIAKGYTIDSWEFGNELCGTGVAARVEAKQYGLDSIVLKGLLNELYQNSTTKPKLVAPGGFYEKKWFSDFLQASGPNVIDGITHHIYNLGAGVDPNLIYKIQDPLYLDQIAQTYKDLETTLKSFGPWSSAWVGESGGAYNSGGKDVSHTFVDGFWYLDQLVSVVGDENLTPIIQEYQMTQGVQSREEYHLTPKDGNIQSDVVLLNNSPLVLTETLDIPVLNPTLTDPLSPISIRPDSIVFASLRDFHAPACA